MNEPVAFIVGAGDYIGAGIAEKSGAEGFEVCMARRNGDKLAPVIEEITKGAGRPTVSRWMRARRSR